jgi:uncharacterized protein YfaS (alpha-2-macroglobulin family)
MHRPIGVALAMAIMAAPGSAQDTLHVLRHAPSDTASPANIITVTFDRPVAAILDRSISPSRVLTITPAIAGTADWRDPVTIRFVPTEPLAPGRRIAVTVATTVTALDGSRLAAPYTFSFRVPGPRLLGRSFEIQNSDRQFLPPDGGFHLLYSAAIDRARLERGARVRVSKCADSVSHAAVALRIIRERPVLPSDPYYFQAENMRYDRDPAGDRFRRVVEMVPVSPLPLDCTANIVLPTTLDDSLYGHEETFLALTAHPFRLEDLSCEHINWCSLKRITISFTSPVAQRDVERWVHVQPASKFKIARGDYPNIWSLVFSLVPRETYSVQVDTAMRDVFGRPLEGIHELSLYAGDRTPDLVFPRGVLTIPRTGAPTIPVRVTNASGIRIISQPIPDAERQSMLADLSFSWYRLVGQKRLRPDTLLVAVSPRLNADTVIEVPAPASLFQRNSPLVAIRFEIAGVHPDAVPHQSRGAIEELSPYLFREPTILQATDLAAHLRTSADESTVYVTGVRDGRPRAGVAVSDIDSSGSVAAQGTTDSLGFARLEMGSRIGPVKNNLAQVIAPYSSRFRLIEATLGDDRLTLPIGLPRYDDQEINPLDPAKTGARFAESPLGAGTVFLDRQIYRPGEMLYFKAVARRGMLGELEVPGRGDSVRIVIGPSRASRDDRGAFVRDTIVSLSRFGTFVDSLPLRRSLPLGNYNVDLRLLIGGRWQTIGAGWFRLAEYRPSEASLSIAIDTVPPFAGDTIRAQIEGRYFFGAPMRGAVVRWESSVSNAEDRDLGIPGTDGWTVGGSMRPDADSATNALPDTGHVTLDANGRATVPVMLVPRTMSQRISIDVSGTFTDLNRQTITGSGSGNIGTSRMPLYLAVRQTPETDPQTPGKPVRVQVRALRSDGTPISGIGVVITTTRQRLLPDTLGGGQWVTDSLFSDSTTTRSGIVEYAFTPDSAGLYDVTLRAPDGQGGTARTYIGANVIEMRPRAGNDVGFALLLVAERRDLSVGDIARVHFDSPFDSADAWMVIERERSLSQRVVSVHRGDNVLSIPIETRHVPNVWVSLILIARPGADVRPDSATRRVRAGSIELRVDPSAKRLSVSVATDRPEFAPGDSISVSVRVRDISGIGVSSEVALWAVDQRVASLTDYDLPDLATMIFQPRGVGQRSRSSLPLLLTNDPSLYVQLLLSRYGRLAANMSVVVGTSAEFRSSVNATELLRRDFRTTAFFLGNVITNDSGNAVTRQRLPDNLTTYRVIAVALDSLSRFGSGDTSAIVSRPLAALPSLPRFVRATDSLFAGAVVSARDSRERSVDVETSADGIGISGRSRQRILLPRGGAVESRFNYAVPTRALVRDTVVIRLGANDGTSADAVETRLPVQPDFHTRAHTVIGVARGPTDIIIRLPAGIDPARSRVSLRVGTSPVASMLGAFERLRLYPYYCTEQIASVGRSIIAIWRATRQTNPNALGGDPLPRLQQIADELASRLTGNGSISYWRGDPWSTPWLTAYAGLFLLDARDLGLAVDSIVIRRIGTYVTGYLTSPVDTGGMNRFEQRSNRRRISQRIASVDFLRRSGAPNTAAEDSLIAVARVMFWEDRLRLAEILSKRADRRDVAIALLDAAWRAVVIAGNRIDLPDTARGARDFPSRVAPAARLLTATLALRPDESRTGGLIETVLQQGRAEGTWAWTTQDYASAVIALASIVDTARASRPARLVSRNGPLAETTSRGDAIPLTGLLDANRDGTSRLALRVDAGDNDRVFYSVQVDEVPLVAPTRPDIQGIVVERWYERYSDGKPITSISEGEFVRVQLRVTVPSTRQFVALEDPLPAGLEAVDPNLSTSVLPARSPFTSPAPPREGSIWQAWLYGSWNNGAWSPWEHKELRDDRVVYFARLLWPGSYTASYIARATTSGTFVRPPAHAEEMYNPAVQGRSDGGRFGVVRKN